MIFTFISLTQTIYAKGMLINSGRKKKKKLLLELHLIPLVAHDQIPLSIFDVISFPPLQSAMQLYYCMSQNLKLNSTNLKSRYHVIIPIIVF